MATIMLRDAAQAYLSRTAGLRVRARIARPRAHLEAVRDLFDATPIPGLTTCSNLIDTDEERLLIEALDACDLTPFRFQGWTGKRLTTSFGWGYDFDLQRLTRASPIPSWLTPLRDRMAAFANLEPELLAQALLIRYDPGAGIGWHRDRPIYEHVLGLSLGAAADMRLRRRRADGSFERAVLPLEPRGAYHLQGEARHAWEHSIVEMAQCRWSITFRSLSERGLRVTART
jgi:DNA oxidative demethylase